MNEQANREYHSGDPDPFVCDDCGHVEHADIDTCPVYPVAGVDYEQGCCALCGRIESHDHPADAYGTFDPDPDYPTGALR